MDHRSRTLLDRLGLAGQHRGQAYFVLGLGAWLLSSTAVITVLVSANKNVRAVLGMAWGLILLWILLGGLLMHRFREPIKRRVLSIRWNWRITFVLFATVLALVEEAITTTMTNLAPLFGVAIGQAYITASANYLDVVALHSVVMFIPMFVAWACILSRYDFSPFAVFILFGCTGILAEVLFAGPSHFAEFGVWIFVYGLMIYLPAYCVPARPKLRTPRWWLYPLATIIPFFFMPLVPTALIAGLLFPNHPKMHFPPIQ